MANRPHPIVLTHSLDHMSDLCIVQVHHFIPIDPQIHSVNLHYVIVLPSFVFSFPHVLYDIVIFFNILHCKKAATLTIFCISYFYFFPKTLLYFFVFAIQSAIASIITNPSCHPCLLCNPFSLLDLLIKWMLLLYFSVCYSTSSLLH